METMGDRELRRSAAAAVAKNAKIIQVSISSDSDSDEPSGRRIPGRKVPGTVGKPGARTRGRPRKYQGDDDEDYDPRKDNSKPATSYAPPNKIRPGPASYKAAVASQMGISPSAASVQPNVCMLAAVPKQTAPIQPMAIPRIESNYMVKPRSTTPQTHQTTAASSFLQSLAAQVQKQTGSTAPLTITLNSGSRPLMQQIFNSHSNTVRIGTPIMLGSNPQQQAGRYSNNLPRLGRPPLRHILPSSRFPAPNATVVPNRAASGPSVTITPINAPKEIAEKSAEKTVDPKKEKENLKKFEMGLIETLVAVNNMTLDMECEEIEEDDHDSSEELSPRSDSMEAPIRKKPQKEYADEEQDVIGQLFMSCDTECMTGPISQCIKNSISGIQLKMHEEQQTAFNIYMKKKEIYTAKRIHLKNVVGRFSDFKPKAVVIPKSNPMPVCQPVVIGKSGDIIISRIPANKPQPTINYGAVRGPMPLLQPNTQLMRHLTSPSFAAINRSANRSNVVPQPRPVLNRPVAKPATAAQALSIPSLANMTGDQALAILQQITQNSASGLPTLIMPSAANKPAVATSVPIVTTPNVYTPKRF